MINPPLKGKAFLILLGGWDMTLGWIGMTYMIPLGKDTSIFFFCNHNKQGRHKEYLKYFEAICLQTFIVTVNLVSVTISFKDQSPPSRSRCFTSPLPSRPPGSPRSRFYLSLVSLTLQHCRFSRDGRKACRIVTVFFLLWFLQPLLGEMIGSSPFQVEVWWWGC